MKYCFGSVCWNNYLERYVNTFVNNYITIYKKLLSLGIKKEDIAEPIICYKNEDVTPLVDAAVKRLQDVTLKKLHLIHIFQEEYSTQTIMYSMRNKLRENFKKVYPTEQKVFFYFPMDDKVLPEIGEELFKLGQKKTPSVCMFQFMVKEGQNTSWEETVPIRSSKDIDPMHWGGYCAYNILDEGKCPLYPKIAVPNVAFYIELYKAGYDEYMSQDLCVVHLRHLDSHHFKYKDSEMTKKVKEYILNQKEELEKKGR